MGVRLVTHLMSCQVKLKEESVCYDSIDQDRYFSEPVLVVGCLHVEDSDFG
jgi:hypothetical protein